MQYSANAVSLIERFEGLRLAPYKDVGGRYTIGYGHLMTALEPIADISADEAWHLLHDDLDRAQHGLNLCLFGTPVTQNQFDALMSWIFNLGAEALEHSTLLKLLRAGDHQGAADEIPKWSHVDGEQVPGLLARRQAERTLFLKAPEANA